MNREKSLSGGTALISTIAILTIAGCVAHGQNDGTLSAFGIYEAYSESLYDEFVRTAEYVMVRDGTKIAVDIYRPAKDGHMVETPMPAVFELTRYWRSTLLPEGKIHAWLFGTFDAGNDAQAIGASSFYYELLRHGYTVVIGANRGTGASYGVNPGSMSVAEAQDAHDVIEWMATQSWSDGNIGMVGTSQSGMNQFITLTEQPPHLKALFPAVANLDFYRISFLNGVMDKGPLLKLFKDLKRLADAGDGAEDGALPEGPIPTPVDEDVDHSMLREARSQHGEGAYSEYMSFLTSSPAIVEVIEELGLETLEEQLDVLMQWDTLSERIADRPDLQERLKTVGFFREDFREDEESSLHEKKFIVPRDHLVEINGAGIPIYVWGGWRDSVSPRDPFLWFDNLTVPVKVAVGPWTHAPDSIDEEDPREIEGMRIRAVESLRWFDYWLKGIDNGIMNEPTINYVLFTDLMEWEWRYTDTWPLPEVQNTNFYFAVGRSSSVDSINDGLLTLAEPVLTGQADTFTVDYSANVTMDVYSVMPYNINPDLTTNDEKGLTYTTAPLEEDVVIAGHPIIVLYATGSASDTEFNVYLEEIESDGTSRFVTHVYGRASHRALGTPPYNYLGLPFTTGLREDGAKIAPFNEGNTTITFDLQPTAWRFKAENRIRVTIQGANDDYTWTFPTVPAEQITVSRSPTYPSHIVLPVLEE